MAELNKLGLDKFQTTMIKRNYSIIKPILTKRDKAQKKIDDKQKELDALKESLQAEINTYNEQIDALDKFTIDTTEKFCGIALTTEQVIDFINDPDKFVIYKHEMGLDETPENTYDENQGEGQNTEIEANQN